LILGRCRDGIRFFATASRPALVPTQSPIQVIPGAVCLEIKRPKREADCLPPSSVEIKNAWRHASTTLQHVFMTQCLIKQWRRLRGMVLDEAQGQLQRYLSKLS
jgi:hypothetical protein